MPLFEHSRTLAACACVLFLACGRAGLASDPRPIIGISPDLSSATSTSTATDTAALADSGPPLGAANLLPWLKQRAYAAWKCGSTTLGPRFGAPHGRSRTCANPEAIASVARQEGGAWPQGASFVKELLGPGNQIEAFAFMRKVAAGTAPDSWYFYLGREGLTLADGPATSGCLGCHTKAGEANSPGRDYIFVSTLAP